jgi:hypothetical protein
MGINDFRLNILVAAFVAIAARIPLMEQKVPEPEPVMETLSTAEAPARRRALRMKG